jgi:hypothetical protein
MKGFADLLVRKAFYDIRDGRMSVSSLIKLAERYVKVQLTEEQKKLLFYYADLIKKEEMSFDEYWKAYLK